MAASDLVLELLVARNTGSPWGEMLNEEADQLRIPGSSTANLFRRRFRLPFLFFAMLMVDVHEWQ